MSESLQPHGLSHTRLPCLSRSPRICSNLGPLSWWCHPSNHLILCCPLLLLPSIFHSIRVFSNELAVRIRWPKYWRLSIKKRLLRCKTGNWELAYPLFHCHSLHCKWSLWYPLPLQLISTISLLRTFQLFSFLSLFLFSWPVYLIILDFPFTDINQDAFSFL